MRVSLRLAVIIAVFCSLLMPFSVNAADLSRADWNSAIIVTNPTEATATFVITYYNSAGDVLATSSSQTIAAHATKTIYISGLSSDGSAVVSSDQNLIAIYRQLSGETTSSPMLYAGFTNSQVGVGKYYLPYLYHSPTNHATTTISIQSLESSTTLTVAATYYPKGGGTPIALDLSAYTLQPNSPVILDSTTLFGSTDREGSLVITTTPGTGHIIATAEETITDKRQVLGYEGSPDGASTVYLPSVMCSYGRYNQNSQILVQNTGGSSADFTIDYYHGSDPKISGASVTVPAYSMIQFNPCSSSGLTTNTTYSAVLNGVGGAKFAVVVRIINSDNMLTAHSGVTSVASSCTGGICTTVLPYVEWSSSVYGLRTYIAVMNASGTAATDASIRYYRADGTVAGIHTIPSIPIYSKGNSTPIYAAGVITRANRSFVGSVVVESSYPVIVLARVQRYERSGSNVITFGEDYIGIPYVP